MSENRSLNIFLVRARALGLTILKDKLEGLGYNVDGLTSPKKAIDFISQCEDVVDLLLVDRYIRDQSKIGTPDLVDCTTVVTKLHEAKPNLRIGVLIDSSDYDVTDLLEMGADFCLDIAEIDSEIDWLGSEIGKGPCSEEEINTRGSILRSPNGDVHREERFSIR